MLIFRGASLKSKSVFDFKRMVYKGVKHSIQYDRPERYLYEFYHSKYYPAFRNQFMKYFKEAKNGTEYMGRYVKLGKYDSNKRMIFLEIENTLLLFSQKKKLKGIPLLYELGKEEASKFHTGPGFIYMRPFSIGFLNTITEKYNIAVYSSLDKNLLAMIIDIMQTTKEFFCLCVTHSKENGPKLLRRFYKEGRNAKNTLMIDGNAKYVAYNSGSGIPILKYRGAKKDSSLLYLEKYLLFLSEGEDIQEQIRNDFEEGIKMNKKVSTHK